MNNIDRIKAIEDLNKDAVEMGLQTLPSIGCSVEVTKASGKIIKQNYPYRTMTKSFHKLNGTMLMQPHAYNGADVNDSTFALPLLTLDDLTTVSPRNVTFSVPTFGRVDSSFPMTPKTNLYLVNQARLNNRNLYNDGIIFGTGGDPESNNSIQLAIPLLTGGHTITAGIIESTYDIPSAKWSRLYWKRFFQPTVRTDIIREVGFITPLMYTTPETWTYNTGASSAATSAQLGLLLDRVFLDESVELGYGDSMQIEYNFEMQMPWASYVAPGGEG